MGAQADLPEEIFTHIVRRHMSVDELIFHIYDFPDSQTIEHFKAVNRHLGDWASPGQLVIITPPESQQCTQLEAELSEAARGVDQKLASMEQQEKELLAQRYDAFYNIAQYSAVGYGIGVNYFKQHRSHVEQVLQEIERAYVQTYNRHGNLKNQAFFQRRKILFMKLNQALDRMVGRSAMGLDFDTHNIKRSLGLSSKSIVHQWKQQADPVTGVPGFEDNYAKTMRYAKALKWGGYIGIALDVGQSGLKIHEACTIGREEECTKAQFTEGGRLVGSVVGGGAGGFAATYFGCNALFGVETAGTSLLWCGIVAGGASGYFVSEHSSDFTEYLGGLLYEASID